MATAVAIAAVLLMFCKSGAGDTILDVLVLNYTTDADSYAVVSETFTGHYNGTSDPDKLFPLEAYVQVLEGVAPIPPLSSNSTWIVFVARASRYDLTPTAARGILEAGYRMALVEGSASPDSDVVRGGPLPIVTLDGDIESFADVVNTDNEHTVRVLIRTRNVTVPSCLCGGPASLSKIYIFAVVVAITAIGIVAGFAMLHGCRILLRRRRLARCPAHILADLNYIPSDESEVTTDMGTLDKKLLFPVPSPQPDLDVRDSHDDIICGPLYSAKGSNDIV